MWVHPPLFCSGSAGDESPTAALRAWLSKMICCKSWARNTLESCYIRRTKTQVCPSFWNCGMTSSTMYTVKNYATVLLKENCQSLPYNIASHLYNFAVASFTVFLECMYSVGRSCNCLSLSYRSSKFALCPRNRFQMIEKPVQHPQNRWSWRARVMEGKRDWEEGKNKERRVTRGG